MTEHLTDEQLAAIQAREAETRRGPWVLRDSNEGDGWPPRPFWVVATSPDQGPDEEDVEIHTGDKGVGEFIAHAREDMPALLAEVTRLRAEAESAHRDAFEAAVAGLRLHSAWRSARRRANRNGYQRPLWLAEVARLRAELVDTQVMRDFHHRSAEHIAGKRDLAETAITSWSSGEMSADAALPIVKKALATAPACTCRAEVVHQAGCDR